MIKFTTKAIKYILRKIFYFITQKLTPIADVDGIKFFGLFRVGLIRGTDLYSREPDMISYLNDKVKKDHIFYDIGANIGVFSMYVAIKLNANVVAFEAESANFFNLNKNIALNKLNNIVAYNLAINDIDEISFLNLSSNVPGGSGHTFKDEKDENGNIFNPTFKQGLFGMSLDNFIYKYKQPFPNHIKIDVDGNEYKIISGMSRTLLDNRLKTIVIEINENESNQGLNRGSGLISVILNNGFVQLHKYVNDQLEDGKMRNFYFERTI